MNILIKKSQSGYSLIELMITITLGSFLILGAAYAFQEATKTYTTNDNVAKLYEQSQYALDLLEEDIRLSNFWGRHNQRTAVIGDSNDALGLQPALQTIKGDCNNQWALNLQLGISGSNEVTPAWAGANCVKDYLAGTDTLVVRHAEFTPVPQAQLQAGQMYIRSNEGGPQAQIFAGTQQPTGLGDEAQNFEFLAHGYFIASNSSGTVDGTPTLMRETLVDGGNAPIVETQEIIRGVEDMQIQFGIDFDSPGQPGYGAIDRYVNPDSPTIALMSSRVLAVRLWLLLRAEQEETGYLNENIYSYANVNTDASTAKAPDDGFRRLLVSKTVQIRNMSNNQ